MTVAATESGGSAFNGRIMLAIITAAILSFVGFLIMSAYAPELNQDKSGRSHVLSNAATGYSGLVRLRQELGRQLTIARNDAALKTENLLVVTPEIKTTPKELGDLIKTRADLPTLIILPKRQVERDPRHRGWVRGRNIIGASRVNALLSHFAIVKVDRTPVKEPIRAFSQDWEPGVAFGKGTVVQTMKGDRLIPYISDDDGNILLAALEDSEGGELPLYILSDPDVMNNLGIGNERMARAATAIIDNLGSGETHAVAFDVTLNGFGASRGLLRLMFEPPFLALSLCLFVASLMALLFGLMRFGPPLRDRRGVAPGKAALVSNTADLIKQAGLELDVSDRYANLARDSAAQALGMPHGMSSDDVIKRLDLVGHSGPAFSELRRNLIFSETRDEMRKAALALFHWRKDKT